ncbi:metallophosphoesterase [Lederbergia wuyishanensis]|uniref:MPP superfamily phosphohydrolase n=1 Tax=Lederbergia wuyishanensis TaxID=1347903 RepID=A0ABU0D104_9BACI|nr:metallophosphoesterase [Lederbergia wuyishanensis]MCJ8006698.1 metallophosphoesterase [Lederbergia wuyishanensis]MDQ0342080.1 putative MPP superfamily phosphohydrolase [Lederbergia wuyishanensis]
MEIIIIAVAIFAVILILYMYRKAFRDDIKFETFHFSNFPKEIGSFRIFFISDIHKRDISAYILDQIKGKTDIVIIGGDLTEKGVSLSRVTNNLVKLKSIAPVFFVWGNNDYEMDPSLLRKAFHSKGINELLNSVYYIKENGKKIALIGLDDFSQELPELDLFMEKINEDSFNILICHNPETVHMVPEIQKISLILSGHTHGGQIRIFGMGPYKKGGIKKVEDTIHLISNGYGTTLVPLRLGANAETHLITIKSENSD